MRTLALLFVAALLAGCAGQPMRDPAPEPGTTIGLLTVQEYKTSARLRIMTFIVGDRGSDAPRDEAERTMAIRENVLTLTWPDGTRETRTNMSFARGPDVYFEAPLDRVGFTGCAFQATLMKENGSMPVSFETCGIYREWFVGIGELHLRGGRGAVDIRVWQAEEGRMADWANGTVQHVPQEMALVDDLSFTAWSLDIGRGRTVEGTSPPGRPAPGVYRLEFEAEDTLNVGIGDLRFTALASDGRKVGHEDADIRLV